MKRYLAVLDGMKSSSPTGDPVRPKAARQCLPIAAQTNVKMESIPGYRTNLSQEEFLRQLKQNGLVLTGQSSDLAPAMVDQVFDAIRDEPGFRQLVG